MWCVTISTWYNGVRWWCNQFLLRNGIKSTRVFILNSLFFTPFFVIHSSIKAFLSLKGKNYHWYVTQVSLEIVVPYCSHYAQTFDVNWYVLLQIFTFFADTFSRRKQMKSLAGTFPMSWKKSPTIIKYCQSGSQRSSAISRKENNFFSLVSLSFLIYFSFAIVPFFSTF